MKRWGAIGVAVVLIAAAVYSLRWRASYQPLSIGNEAVGLGDRIPGSVLHPDAVTQSETYASPDFREVDDSYGADDNRRHVTTDYVDGQHVVFAYTLHNSGRVGVTVTGLAPPAKFAPLAMTSVPFHPFKLGAGATRDIVVHERMHACEWYQPGGSVTFEGLDLSYRVLGLHRTASIKAPVRTEIAFPGTYHCPRTRPGRFEGDGLAFDFEQSWHTKHFDEPQLVTYLSTEPIYAVPIDRLKRDGVLIAFYDGPKGDAAPENVRMEGVRAHKTVWHRGCAAGNGDESTTVALADRSGTTRYTMTACLRGPDLAFLRGQVDRMLRSADF